MVERLTEVLNGRGGEGQGQGEKGQAQGNRDTEAMEPNRQRERIVRA
jgi:hypothetical protein